MIVIAEDGVGVGVRRAPGRHGAPVGIRDAVARGKDGPVGAGARVEPGEIVRVVPLVWKGGCGCGWGFLFFGGGGGGWLVGGIYACVLKGGCGGGGMGSSPFDGKGRCSLERVG